MPKKLECVLDDDYEYVYQRVGESDADYEARISRMHEQNNGKALF